MGVCDGEVQVKVQRACVGPIVSVRKFVKMGAPEGRQICMFEGYFGQ